MCNASAKGRGLRIFFVHVQGIEVAADSSVEVDVRFCYGFGETCPVSNLDFVERLALLVHASLGAKAFQGQVKNPQ